MHSIEHQSALAARIRRVGWAALLVAVAVAGLGVFRRSHSENNLRHWTAEQAVPYVTLVSPEKGSAGQELVLPGDIEANYEAPIHARVGGYLKMWYRDIGAHVKAGELLAQIDTPDLDQQLLQAKATLESAQADARLADLTARRWQASLVANAVSQQTIDEKVGDAQARRAQADAAAANVERLNVLESFKRVTAPFAGVVTSRKTDVGALISADGDSGSELFRVADLSRIRVYVHVPQSFSTVLTPGLKVQLKLPQFPDQMFEATLDTTANAVDPGSRTVLAEFLAENPGGKLWPGTFAEAHLQIPGDPQALNVPASALIFRKDGLQLAVLGEDGRALLRSVQLGRDLGSKVEVRSGLNVSDRVIDSPPASLATGDVVRTTSARS